MGVNGPMTATLASLFQQQPGQAPPAPGTALPPAMPAAPTPPPMGIYSGAAMGPTNAPQPTPTMGSDNPMQDYANLSQQQLHQIWSDPSAPAREAEAARAGIQTKAGEIAGATVPQLHPKIDASKGWLHNLGQALQLVAMATPEGRQIFSPTGPVYGQRALEYQQGQAGRAQQMKAYEERAEGAGKEVGAEASVAGRAIMGGARLAGAQVTAGQRDRDTMARIRSAQSIAEKGNIMKEEIARIKAEQAQRDAEIMANAHIAGIEEETRIQQMIQASHDQRIVDLQAAGFAEDPSFWGDVKRAIGITSVGTAGAGQPQVKPTTPPGSQTKPAAQGAPKGNVAYKVGGTTYHIPAAMEKEFLKDHPNAKRQ